jgi:quinol monooxygenase YgiN
MNEIILIAKLQAKPGHHEELEKELKLLVKGTCKEPECLLYALHRDADDPSRFVIIEKWASKKALDTHTSLPHFLRYRKYAVPILVGMPELVFLEPLGEGDKGGV